VVISKRQPQREIGMGDSLRIPGFFEVLAEEGEP